MKPILEKAVAFAKPSIKNGKLADYIPVLTHAHADHLGVSVATLDGQFFNAGDTDVSFTIQSVSKIFSLALVLQMFGEDRLSMKVGMEPSGNPFYSLVQLEYESGKPRNPFINAGAIAVTGMIPGETGKEKIFHLLSFMESITGQKPVVDEVAHRSEYETSHRNRALGHFMKHFGIIDGSVMESVDTYFRQCAITMTCSELARIGLFLANRGIDPIRKNTIVTLPQTHFINAMMTACGLYDASGEFAVRVGLPGKSGVGGGILAIVPGKMVIATFGPSLDEKGNSIGGLKILEYLSKELNLSLFA